MKRQEEIRASLPLWLKRLLGFTETPLLLLVALSPFAQEHAPTVEQCRADAKLWHQPMHADSTHQVVKKMAYPELAARAGEMYDCIQVDDARDIKSVNASDEIIIAYYSLETIYAEQLASRYRGFIIRYNLNDQFLAEDDEGKR